MAHVGMTPLLILPLGQTKDARVECVGCGNGLDIELEVESVGQLLDRLSLMHSCPRPGGVDERETGWTGR